MLLLYRAYYANTLSLRVHENCGYFVSFVLQQYAKDAVIPPQHYQMAVDFIQDHPILWDTGAEGWHTGKEERSSLWEQLAYKCGITQDWDENRLDNVESPGQYVKRWFCGKRDKVSMVLRGNKKSGNLCAYNSTVYRK